MADIEARQLGRQRLALAARFDRTCGFTGRRQRRNVAGLGFSLEQRVGLVEQPALASVRLAAAPEGAATGEEDLLVQFDDARVEVLLELLFAVREGLLELLFAVREGLLELLLAVREGLLDLLLAVREGLLDLLLALVEGLMELLLALVETLKQLS